MDRAEGRAIPPHSAFSEGQRDGWDARSARAGGLETRVPAPARPPAGGTALRGGARVWAEQTLRARPVGCDAESGEDAELMCGWSSKGEKLLFNQPALESAVRPEDSSQA